MGTKGKVLMEFVCLIREYFKTRKNSLNPGKFKRILCQHLSMFEGYSQHDSQEFLSLFMDSVHEDLNRILNKPYTETVEGNKNSDIYGTARISWLNFMKRNYSFLINSFYG